MDMLGQMIILLTKRASVFACVRKESITSVDILFAYLDACEHPFSALDPVNQKKIQNAVVSFKKKGVIFPKLPITEGFSALSDEELSFDADGNRLLEETLYAGYESKTPLEIITPLYLLLRTPSLQSAVTVIETSKMELGPFQMILDSVCPAQVPVPREDGEDDSLPRGSFIFRSLPELRESFTEFYALGKFAAEEDKEEKGKAEKDALPLPSSEKKVKKPQDHWSRILDDLDQLEVEFGNDSPDPSISKDTNPLPPLHFISDMNNDMQGEDRAYFRDEEVLLNAEIALDAKDSLLIEGKSGVGKSQLVKELVVRMNNKAVKSEFLRKCHIYKINTNALSSNCAYVGQFEGRINSLLSFVRAPLHSGMILYFDELSLVMGLGNTDGRTHSAVNDYFKEPMSEGHVIVIGCCTPGESLEIQRLDPAFYRRFDTIAIQEISADKLRPLLEKEIEDKADLYSIKVSPNFAESVILMGNLLENGQANPAKDLKLVDRAFSYARLTDKKAGVNSEVLSKAIMGKYNLKIQENAALKTKEALLKALKGQEEPIDQVYEALLGIEQNLPRNNKPSASLGFFGPSGVGKTETARIIAQEFCGSANALVKIDCGQFNSATDIDYLFGGEQGGILIQALSLNPRCCLLFDEIEKAPDRLRTSVMAMLDDGIVKDLQGVPHSARGAIIILTSNVGASLHLGQQERNGLLKQEVTEANYFSALKESFFPEFLSRIDRKIFFNHLSNETLTALILQDVEEAKGRASKAILPLEWKEEDTLWVKRDADVETQGARAIESSVEKRLLSLYRKKYEL
jgi:MoxR-like ATPase